MQLVFDNLIIDRVSEAVAESQDGKIRFLLNQLTDVTLTGTSENKDKLDAQGVLIKRFYTSKAVEFSAQCSLLSLSQMAVQAGTTLEVASGSHKIKGPHMLQIPAGVTDYTIPENDRPLDGTLTRIYTKLSNGGLGTEYEINTVASTTQFQYDKEMGKITLPTSVDGPFIGMYEIETDNGVRLVNRSDKFPGTVKLTLRVLCVDPCSIGVLRYAYIIIPSFQVSPDVELNLSTDSTFQLSGVAQVDYCSEDKALYEIFMSGNDVENNAA